MDAAWMQFEDNTFEFWIPPRILQTAKFTTLCEKYNELYSTPQQQRTHRRKGALKRVGERSWGPTLAATSCLWQPLCSGSGGRSVRAAAGFRPSSTAWLSCTPSNRPVCGVLRLGSDDCCAPAGCGRAPPCAPPREVSAAGQRRRQVWPRGDEQAGGGAAAESELIACGVPGSIDGFRQL